jgi:hypothetical protein
MCVGVILTSWFKGKELTLAFAFPLAVARGGILLDYLTIPKLTEVYGISFALWISFLVCLLSLVCSFLIYIYHKPGGIYAEVIKIY